jgi:hypothetical protein
MHARGPRLILGVTVGAFGQEMAMNKKTILWLTISGFLLFASGFSLYIAAYNWWAADFRSE